MSRLLLKEWYLSVACHWDSCLAWSRVTEWMLGVCLAETVANGKSECLCVQCVWVLGSRMFVRSLNKSRMSVVEVGYAGEDIDVDANKE